jgi:hypothetical protein
MTQRWREMDSNFQFPVAKPRSASRHGGPSWLLGYGSGSVGDRRFESISLQRRVQCEPSLGFADLLDRKWTGKLALNDNLAIHSKDSFWTLPKDQASLNALARTTRRRPVQTGRLPVAVLRFVKEFEPAFPSGSSLSEIQGS